MAHWGVREELSQVNRLRRSYYELLRDELDSFLIQYGMIDSYSNFAEKQRPYPFVEKRELKPRARIPDLEYKAQNAFLVLFVEESIPSSYKKFIRFFDDNRTTKTNLLRSGTLPLSNRFDRTGKFLDAVHFFDFMKILLPVDYALLIQRNPAGSKKGRYELTHYHVRIDWPIANAAEDMARSLRYISKDLYEKGEKYAEDIQKKFFEYYGLPVTSGGRRTAAVVAAQYLKGIDCISTVYAGSSESRSLIRISERGVSKTVLMRLSDEDASGIADGSAIHPAAFRKNYVVAREDDQNVCLLQAAYDYTSHSRPPEDGKLRELKPDVNWLTVGTQLLLPKPGVWKYPPLPTNVIYT